VPRAAVSRTKRAKEQRMCHALIIDDNIAVRCGVMDQLAGCGFTSFDHAWTERQALAAAEQQLPDLIVIGETIADGSPFPVASRISDAHGIPILRMTSVSFRLHRPAPDCRHRAGPFYLDEIGEAIALCREIPSWGAPVPGELVG
jgi:hypothetical protein